MSRSDCLQQYKNCSACRYYGNGNEISCLTLRAWLWHFLGFCGTSHGWERVFLMKEWPRSLLRHQVLQLKWYSKKVGVGFFSKSSGRQTPKAVVF